MNSITPQIKTKVDNRPVGNLKDNTNKSYTNDDLPVRVDDLTLLQLTDGQYQAQWAHHAAMIHVVRCFPWSEPFAFVSLRDYEELEIALIEHVEDLTPSSQKVLEQALAEAGFVLEITRVVSLEEEFELRNWVVETIQGKRTFQTRRDEWPRKTAQGGLIIRDIHNDTFFISDVKTLDAESQKRLTYYVD